MLEIFFGTVCWVGFETLVWNQPDIRNASETLNSIPLTAAVIEDVEFLLDRRYEIGPDENVLPG